MKKAGHFLDNLKIYLSGFSEKDQVRGCFKREATPTLFRPVVCLSFKSTASLHLCSRLKNTLKMHNCFLSISTICLFFKVLMTRVLKYAGATRLTQLVDSVTHVVHAITR